MTTAADVPDAARTRDDLARLRPDLVAGYDTALPGARAAVLTRLWGAIGRETLPGLGRRAWTGDRLTVTMDDGGTLTGPAAATAPFADAAGPVPGPRLEIHSPDGAVTDPVHLARLTGMPERFRDELANSVANLTLARANAFPTPTLKQLADDPEGLATAEQSVVDGHPIHPCCRTRAGLSTEEILAYAPEHRTIVELAEVRVPEDRWYGEGPPILMVHPWQRDHVLDAHPALRPTGRTRPARPLMSLRTLAPVGRRSQHVKTAVDVQMTSAVRTVSPAAVRNGPVVSVLLHTLATDLPGLTILRETFAGAVLVDGEPSRSLAYLAREAPRQAPGEVILPLAALAQPALQKDAVDTGFGGDPAAFLQALVTRILPPLLVMLHRGVALEAHGQNTLVALRDGVPTRVLYRDLGGIRISPARLRHHGFTLGVPSLHGDLGTDDPDALRTKLLASAVSGTIAEQIAVLTRTHDVAPDPLWGVVAAVARDTYDRLGTGDDAGLFHATLPLKATTAMRLATDPLDDAWTHLDNPMTGLR
ncbi:siderophore synthetase component [Catenuloplanes nepalensis]|uniref:Siderophore synthetase component n=1 Tax=Catenuloplanes nepalensis TaxID=587533 RepID=A0ABT9MSY7_9ACTN|nr:IucA/IucC family protein [Catenuloplanes nepalensis]MDP9794545.1 siderophore synthetase component [Catenuloplanes nepalensis]